MRRIFTISFLFISVIAFAQPANDDCDGLIDLGVAPFCDFTVFFDNVDATPSDIGNDNIPNINDCPTVGTMQNDVWFSFIASDTIEDYLITVTGITDGSGSTPMVQPQVALYRGDCEFDGLEALNCEVSDAGGAEVSLSVSGLDPGLTYYIRVSDWSDSATPNEGTFQLCIEEVNIWTPDDDITITTCSGDLYDAGGPDGDYPSGMNYTVTIAPSGGGPGGCVFFTMEYYNVANDGDGFTVTNGSANLMNSSNLSGFGDDIGGVGFEVFSNTGIIELNFNSNNSTEFEGFYATWECSTDPCPTLGDVTIDNTITNADIEEFLSTPYAQVTVVDVNCDDRAKGLFEADELSGLGIEKGIVLASGEVQDIGQPSTNFISTGLNSGGDDDLDAISAQTGGANSNDACVIELDVFTNTDIITFDYRFGSEEYPNYVGSTFNDIFALLISDTGSVINGPAYLNGQENMAILPNGDEVSINSVNFNDNWQHYTSNVANNISANSIAYGGLTSGYLGSTPYLTAERVVDPCNTYRLKFAIADRGDSAFDSGVFISEIRGSSPSITGEFNFPNMPYLLESEDCKTNGILNISVDSVPTQPEVYYIVATGTADLIDDFNLNLPDSIIISSSNTSYNFAFSAIQDNIVEGDETLTISLVRDYGCGEVVVSEFEILIREEVEVDIINIDSDTAYVCAGDSIQLIASGAEIFQWSPNNPPIFNPDDEFSTWVTPTETTQVSIFGYLAEAPQIPACRDIDTLQLIVIEPEIEITTDDPTGICVGDTITLTAENNVGDNGITWTPGTFLNVTDEAVVQVNPTNNNDQTYIARVELQGCSAQDTITIEVDNITIPTILDDQILCESYPIQLGQDVGNTTTTFEWLPDVYLDDNTSPNPTSNPEDTITYTFIATSQNAFCADTSQLTLTVIEADIDILNPESDSIDICLGDTVFVNTEVTAGGMDLLWTPDDGSISATSSENFQLYPEVSTMYYGTYSVGPCLVYDSIYVRVDSLPDLEFSEFLPFRDPYCQGDSFLIISPIYEPNNFPDMEHLWTSVPGGITSDTFYNMFVNALESGDFTRVTTNKACSDTVTTFIEVIEPFLTLSPQDSVICPGDSIVLYANGPNDMGSIQWDSGVNLSCDTCAVTTATPGGSESFTVTAVVQGCEDSETLNLFVTQIDAPGLQDLTICLDETIVLNENGPFDDGSDYTWVLEDGTVLGQDPTLEVMPDMNTSYFLVMEEGNCVDSFQVNIDVISEPPTLMASEDILICIGESTDLQVVESSSIGIYTWEPGDVEGEIISVSPTESTQYVITGDYGCFEVTDTVNVLVGQGFNILDIISAPGVDSIFEGDQVNLLATMDPELGNYVFNWAGEGLTSDNAIGTTLIAPSVEDNNTPFTYTLVVEDEYGCQNTFEITIFVDNSQVAVPTVFIPGSPIEENAVFNIITNEGTDIIEFEVFNRWGERVYSRAEDVDGDGWDGNINGNPAPMDVYAYYALVEFNDGTQRELRGEITLIR